MRRKEAWKWAVIGGAIAFLVLYGIEAASTGIERIYGPVENGSPLYVADRPDADENAANGPGAERSGPAADEQTAGEPSGTVERTDYREERLPGIPRTTYEPSVNRVADGAAGFLQSVTSGGIRFIVALFDSVTR
ncbi:hypothetical protein PACILC2_08340 [Paenibacillus cisolokensis]|uniref:Uncharacterized protein n=1 Tax=Paenibacillus cisolokensis TaxID=1658519 RepID=A0ABQ4N2S4_9BACL|nr:hypothetical protein [Paenibacillus cisolokensis]GIQ62266.1 hypothetical protein PACILC2_08340 [Paenibacillus cisolokensis]